MNIHSTLPEILRILANAIDDLSPEDILALEHRLADARGTRRLRELLLGALLTVAQQRDQNKSRHSTISAEEIDREITKSVSQNSSRVDLYECLDSFRLIKPELIELARLRNVHLLKSDDMKRIRDKLVESFIGARLNSEAIQNFDKKAR